MKIIAGIVLLISGFAAQAQKKASPAITRYIVMTGTIDKYPVTFHLYQVNNDFSGTYYYNSSEIPIDFTGSSDSARFLKLSHFSENDDNGELFEGVFKDSSFSGTWSYKGKLLPFYLKRQKDTDGLSFDYICTSGSKKIPKREEGFGPEELFFDAATIWPTAISKHPAADSIKQFIRESFGEKNSKEEIGKILLRRKNELLNPATDDIEVYSSTDQIQVIYRTPRLLTIKHLNSGYYGGAHGIYGTGYTCFSLVQNKRLELADVLDTLAAKAVLEKLLEKKFREDYRVKAEEKLEEVLLVDKIPANDNFLLTGKGIGFNYVPYEIGAFAMGEVKLFIPFTEIEKYLKPSFKKLLNQ